MMTPKERAAMQQALEALEEMFHSNSTKIAVEKYDMAHNALRDALDHSGESNEMVIGWERVKPEAIASDPLYQQGFVDGVEEGRNQVAEQAEQSQLADATLEPVAWMRLNEKGECEAIEYIGNVDEHLYLPPSCQWLYTSPVLTMQQVEPKPVAKVGHLHQSIVEACGLPMSTLLYAAPVRTKALTDDEINELWLTHGQGQMMYIHEKFARAVIQEYRRKNGIV